MVAFGFLSLLTTGLPCFLHGAWKVMQFPLLHGCLLCPARSVWSIRRSGATIASPESSLACLGLPAIASGGYGVWFIQGVAVLLGPKISSIITMLRILFVVYTPSCVLVVVLSSIVAPGSMRSSGSMLPGFARAFSPVVKDSCIPGDFKSGGCLVVVVAFLFLLELGL